MLKVPATDLKSDPAALENILCLFSVQITEI